MKNFKGKKKKKGQVWRIQTEERSTRWRWGGEAARMSFLIYPPRMSPNPILDSPNQTVCQSMG